MGKNNQIIKIIKTIRSIQRWRGTVGLPCEEKYLILFNILYINVLYILRGKIHCNSLLWGNTSQLRSFFSFEQKHNSQSLIALVVKMAAFPRYQKYWPLIGNWAKISLFNQLHNGWLEDLKMSWLSEKPISSQPGSYKT